MKKVRFSKSDPASFQRGITHAMIDGENAAYRWESGETFSLHRKVSQVRCHVLDLYHRSTIRFDNEPDPDRETLECKFYFTRTLFVGEGVFIRLVNQAVTFVRAEEPYLCERNFFKAKHLQLTEEERARPRWPTEIHRSRFRSDPASFGDRDEVGLPAFSFPAAPSSDSVQLPPSVFDALVRHLSVYQENTELQAWVEIEAYFGDSGIVLVPASGFQFARIKQFVVGNLVPLRSSKQLSPLPADYMYRL